MKVFEVNGNWYEDSTFNHTLVERAKADERTKVLDEVLGLKPQIYAWLIKREKGGYGTTLGECTDKIFEEIEKVFKSHK